MQKSSSPTPTKGHDPEVWKYGPEPRDWQKPTVIGPLIGVGWDCDHDGDCLFCRIALDDVYEFKLTWSRAPGGEACWHQPIIQLSRDARFEHTGVRTDYAYSGGPVSLATAMEWLSMPATKVMWLLFNELKRLREAPVQWEYLE